MLNWFIKKSAVHENVIQPIVNASLIKFIYCRSNVEVCNNVGPPR